MDDVRANRLLAGLCALALLLALPFAVLSILQGLDGIDGVQAQPTRFLHSDAPLANLGIFAHMIAGGLVTCLALLQAIPQIRARRPRLHRASGRVVIAASLVTALGGLVYIALKGTIGGPWMSAGFTLYGLCIGGCALATWRAARDGRYGAHRRWGLRMIWLAIGSWLYRVQYGLWHAATGGLASNAAFDGAFDRFMFIGFFVPHLIALEIYLRRRGDIEPLPQRG